MGEFHGGRWIWMVTIPVMVVPAAITGEIKFDPIGKDLMDTGAQAPSMAIGQSRHGMRYAGGQPLSPSRIEDWILYYTNAEREAAGLRPLTHDPAISKIARGHSRNMISLGVYAHEIHGKDPTDRALEAGYTCRAYRGDGSYSYGLSENISRQPRITRWSVGSTAITPQIFSRDFQDMALRIVQGWMNSPVHRKNILDRDTRRIGVGVAVRYEKITQSAHLTQETVFATQNFSACQ